MAFSATQAAISGVRLIGRRPGVFAAWFVLLILSFAGLMVAYAAIMWPLFAPPFHGHYPAELATRSMPHFIFLPLGCLAAVALFSIFVCAVFRAELRPGDRGWAYLRFGGDELRYIGLQVILMILCTVALVVAMTSGVTLVWLVPGDGWKSVAGGFYGVLIFGLMIYAGVRLSLAAPMTFAERGVRVFESWGLTRHQALPLIGMWAIAIALASIPSFFTVYAMEAALFSVVPMTPHAMASPIDWARAGPTLAIGGAFYLAAIPFQFVLQTAPPAAAYRALAAARAGEV